MLVSNGASIVYATLIAVAVLVGLNAQLTTGVIDVVPRLHSQINRIQNIELISIFSRLLLLGFACFTYFNAVVAILAASISFVIKRFILGLWITDTISVPQGIGGQR